MLKDALAAGVYKAQCVSFQFPQRRGVFWTWLVFAGWEALIPARHSTRIKNQSFGGFAFLAHFIRMPLWHFGLSLDITEWALLGRLADMGGKESERWVV